MGRLLLILADQGRIVKGIAVFVRGGAKTGLGGPVSLKSYNYLFRRLLRNRVPKVT